jgi:small subunit ribosomal protein S25e
MGTKKLSISQIEKQQWLREKKRKEREKAKKREAAKLTQSETFSLNVEDAKFLDEVSKMRVLTPYSLASRYGIKVSSAKDVLEELEKRNVIELVRGCSRIKIYRPISPD